MGARLPARILRLIVVAAFAAAFPAAAAAASQRPVCPGPAGPDSARCHAHVVTEPNGTPRASTGPSGYGPTQFHTAYSLRTTSPSAQTIAIVDAYDDPNIASDLAT